MNKDASHSAATQTVRPEFDTVLLPHRSLGPRGFSIFMLGVSGVSFIAGIFFYSIGAWPVVGIFGLDLLLIYGAFKLNYYTGQQHERITLFGSELLVSKTTPTGKSRSFRFDAYWVRVELVPVSQERTRLLLRSHGIAHVIGRFLNDEEKRSLAHALAAALLRFRTVQPAVPND